jgi:hypothetical protein
MESATQSHYVSLKLAPLPSRHNKSLGSLLISIKPEKESVLLLIASKRLVAVTHSSSALVNPADPQY